MAEKGLEEGGIGIGLVPGYAPGARYMELLAMQTLAAKYSAPTYWHVRSEGESDPLSAAQAYGEAISCAAGTESWVHICHLNSTSFHDINRAARMIQSAQKQGLKITVEAYPYGAASTAIGAATIAPENLPRAGMTYESIEYQGRRLNEHTFNELRSKSPGAIVVVHFLELPRDQEMLDISVLYPGAIIASDAMPWLSTKTGEHVDDDAWPLPDDAFSHPRSAGTHARFLGQYVRERNLISLSDAIAKTAYLPAKLLEETVPQLKKKGRLQAGMDADIVVFDPAGMTWSVACEPAPEAASEFQVKVMEPYVGRRNRRAASLFGASNGLAGASVRPQLGRRTSRREERRFRERKSPQSHGARRKRTRGEAS